VAAANAEPSVDDVAQTVPPLVKTYIRAGARVCSQPVIDRDFNCADWLTVLDMKRLTGSYDRKYMQE
jgi:putative hemolysin